MLRKLNIGCGSTYHPDWVNLDVSPVLPDVQKVNINKGLPFSTESVDVCYSSHVLEHLDTKGASSLIGECFRVLKHGGAVRLVLPDLEAIAREYLRILESLSSGDSKHESDYDWIMLEFYDQTVRNFSGGEMVKFLEGLDVKDRHFVLSRIGIEAENFWKPKQTLSAWFRIIALVKRNPWENLFNLSREKIAGWLVYLIAGKVAYKNFQIGTFRSSGEVHQWMYDRYSLKRLLEQAGFVNVKICAANESRIPEFAKYSLDVLNGVVRKPDSFFAEASKP
jgi:predicted SAM-dependent methyltransferase